MDKYQLMVQYGLTDSQFMGVELIKGSLDMGGLCSLPDGFNPNVEMDLNLSGLTKLPLIFHPIVGGDLYLSSIKSISLCFSPKVFGDLHLDMIKNIDIILNVGGYLYGSGYRLMIGKRFASF